MDELTIEGQIYLSSKKAAKLTGYAKDYVGQLAREGRVQARLVGRNWYVLESSIREHRFGQEIKVENPAEEIEEGSVSTEQWPITTTYTPEPIVPMAPLEESVRSQKIESEEIAVQKEMRAGAVLSDMQTIWQDWFNKRHEMLLEPAEAGDIPLSSNEKEEETLQSPEIPATLPRLGEELVQEQEEVAIPIHRSYSTYPIEEATRQAIEKDLPRARSEETESKGVPLSTASVGKASLSLNALFISIIGLAIAVFIVGSGLASTYIDRYAHGNGVQYAIYRFVSGQFIVSK